LVFKWLRRRKGKSVEKEEEELEEIKKIEEYTERLEGQWEDFEKEYRLYGFGSSSQNIKIPAYHFYNLWDSLIKVKKKIKALEYLINLEKKKGTTLTNRDKKSIGRLKKIIRYKKHEIVGTILKEINKIKTKVKSAVEIENSIFEKIMTSDIFKTIPVTPENSRKGEKPATKADKWKSAERETRRWKYQMRQIFRIPVTSIETHYDYKKRIAFLNFVNGECNKISARLIRLL
jgi:hypothetical protein